MMEYACPLSQSHPHKLYFILRNICHVGDRYDDEFCTKFGARRSYEPQVTPLSGRGGGAHLKPSGRHAVRRSTR